METLACRSEQADIRWAVPHMAWLLTTYDCHMNVEVVATIAVCKCLFSTSVRRPRPAPATQRQSPAGAARRAGPGRAGRALVLAEVFADGDTTSTLMWQSYLVRDKWCAGQPSGRRPARPCMPAFFIASATTASVGCIGRRTSGIHSGVVRAFVDVPDRSSPKHSARCFATWTFVSTSQASPCLLLHCHAA